MSGLPHCCMVSVCVCGGVGCGGGVGGCRSGVNEHHPSASAAAVQDLLWMVPYQRSDFSHCGPLAAGIGAERTLDVAGGGGGGGGGLANGEGGVGVEVCWV